MTQSVCDKILINQFEMCTFENLKQFWIKSGQFKLWLAFAQLLKRAHQDGIQQKSILCGYLW